MTVWHAYLGIDQYGTHYTMQKHPRKELMEQLGARGASKMYRERRNGADRHVGYVVGGRWITVYKVTEAFGSGDDAPAQAHASAASASVGSK